MPVQFVNPSFLFFLSLVAIPIIIHLFNFRRYKKIDFTNVRFLKELKDETQSQSKLKHLLVLLSRILAVSFLVFAFAQPFIPKTQLANSSGEQVVSLYVDNSFSMMGLTGKGNLLEEAKTKARETAEALPASTQFQLLTNDFRGEQQRLVSKEELTDAIDKIKVSPVSRTAKEILTRQQDALNSKNEKNKVVYWFSDFQKTFFNQLPSADTLLQLNAVMLSGTQTGNIYIDSCYLATPVIQLNVPAELTVKFKNTGSNDAAEIPVRFTINDVQKSVASVQIPANGEAFTKINFTVTEPGWQRAAVSIDDNPITFDDTYYFSFSVAKKINVYHIGNNYNSFVQTLFNNNDLINYTFTKSNAVDFSLFQNNNTIVLTDIKQVPTGMSDELKKFVNRGGTLVIFPDTLIETNGFAALANGLNMDNYAAINYNADKVSRLDLENELFKNVFDKVHENMNMPDVISHYQLSSGIQSNREVLMRLQGGAPFLCRYAYGKGKTYLFTSAAREGAGNFVKHALFVPIVFNTALLSIPSNEQSLTLGKKNSAALSYSISADKVVHLVNKKSNYDFIPQLKSTPGETSVILPDELISAGSFDLISANDSLLAVLSLNYNRSESDISFSTAEEINNSLGKNLFKQFNIIDNKVATIGKHIKELNSGISLWKYCIILVLFFLGAEVLLLRYL